IYGTQEDMQAVFLDPSTLCIGGKSWIRKMVDLSASKGESVKQNEAVQVLINKVKADLAVWIAGVVPAGKGTLPTGGEMKTIALNMDFAAGLAANVYAGVASAADATKLTTETQSQLTQAKQNPMMAMMGLGPIIDGTKIVAEGSSMHVTVAL